MIEYAWLIPLLPLVSFALIVFVTGRNRLLSAGISIAAIAASFVIAAGVGLEFLHNPETVEYGLPWVDVLGLRVEMGVLLDGISVLMLLIVTFIATLIQIYSLGYMHEDPGFSRYYSYMSLFAFSMLGLVVATNFLQLYIFFELVGLASYLLIGFWYEKHSAAEAAKKAFVTTRAGDFGLLLGILILFSLFGTFDFTELADRIAGFDNIPLLTLLTVLIFLGPVGKSAQVPLHVWLPDAMEGPTPVSALIHAATMVAAGVYLVARTYFLFANAPVALTVVAWVGGITALFAATIATAQDDIKRVLAYSTISQLGYMMLALGVGGFTASMFHLTTHAFFKALLFLGAGSVIIGLHHKQNIWEMGGLYKKMPITTVTFLVGSLALAGLFPFAGFWSKDSIFAVALEHGQVALYWLAVAAAFLTAFYTFRLFFVAFMGRPRSDHHAVESPPSMTGVLVILALFAIGVGFIGSPFIKEGFGHFIYFGKPHVEHLHMNIALTSTAVTLAGITLAWLVYSVRVTSFETLSVALKPAYLLLKNKYYIDEIYRWVGERVVEGFGFVLQWFDRTIIDGVVNGTGTLTEAIGRRLRVVHTGDLQTYALVILSGVALLFAILALVDPVKVLKLGGIL